MDEEGDDEEQDETWVKPVSTSEVPADDSTLGVAVTLRLAGGLVYPGVMFCATQDGFDVAALALLTTEGRVLFSQRDPPGVT